MNYQRKDWAMQRIGWAIMAVIVLAALLGLLGGAGPLSLASVRTEDGSLQLEYLRFIHLLEPNQLRLYVQTAPAQDELRIRLNDDYIHSFGVDSISPEPESVEASEDSLIYVFQVSPEERVEIVFHLNPIEAANLHGRIGLEDGRTIEFDQIIFP
jgi:hypothetical protein